MYLIPIIALALTLFAQKPKSQEVTQFKVDTKISKYRLLSDKQVDDLLATNSFNEIESKTLRK